MEMGVPDSLASGCSNIEANVDPAIGPRFSEVSLHQTGQLQNSRLLFQRQGEEVWLVTSGDNKRMARRYGIGVLKCHRQIRRSIVLA
jgi:hypothetical protein